MLVDDYKDSVQVMLEGFYGEDILQENLVDVVSKRVASVLKRVEEQGHVSPVDEAEIVVAYALIEETFPSEFVDDTFQFMTEQK